MKQAEEEGKRGGESEVEKTARFIREFLTGFVVTILHYFPCCI